MIEKFLKKAKDNATQLVTGAAVVGVMAGGYALEKKSEKDLDKKDFTKEWKADKLREQGREVNDETIHLFDQEQQAALDSKIKKATETINQILSTEDLDEIVRLRPQVEHDLIMIQSGFIQDHKTENDLRAEYERQIGTHTDMLIEKQLKLANTKDEIKKLIDLTNANYEYSRFNPYNAPIQCSLSLRKAILEKYSDIIK